MPSVDLRKLGQKTTVARSTLDQVRAKIAALRESTKAATTAKNYDFEQRLKEIKEGERKERTERKERKRKEKEERMAAEGRVSGYRKAPDPVTAMEVENGDAPGKGVKAMEGVETEEDQMMKMMGFSGGFRAGR